MLTIIFPLLSVFEAFCLHNDLEKNITEFNGGNRLGRDEKLLILLPERFKRKNRSLN